jgi:hypothetical protein
MPLKKISLVFILLVLPVLFALVLPVFFRLGLFLNPGQLTSIIAMIVLPVGIGLLTIFVSTPDQVSKSAYNFFMPWIPIIVFFITAFALQLEECACWMIGLPVFLLLSSLGGFTARYFKRRYQAVKTLPADSK